MAVPQIVAALVLMAILQIVTTLLRNRVFARMQSVIIADMGSGLMRRLLTAPMRFFTSRALPDLAQRTHAVAPDASVLAGPVSQALLGSTLGIAATVMLFALQPLLALVALLVAAAFLRAVVEAAFQFVSFSSSVTLSTCFVGGEKIPWGFCPKPTKKF